MTAEIAAPKRNGLVVLWDVLVAPSAAFAEFRNVPHWGWAFLLTCVLGTIGGYLQVPAGEHIANYTIAHDARFASFTPEQLASAKRVSLLIQHFSWIFYAIQALVAVTLSALILLVANAIGRGSANFAKLFALSVNVGFLNFGIGFLLHGIIASTRGPESFSTTVDLLGVIPSLGWLVPGAAPKLVAFLTSINIFQVWSTVLIALGLRSVAGLSPVIAWTTPIVVVLLGGLLVTATVH